MPKKLLLADESKTIRKVIEMIFAKRDFEILFAGSDQETLKIVQTHTPDIVLLDVGISGRGGYDLCKLIKSSPAYKNIPIILLSSAMSEYDSERATKSGASAHATKPVESASIIALIDSLLLQKKRISPSASSDSVQVSDEISNLDLDIPELSDIDEGLNEESLHISESLTLEDLDAEPFSKPDSENDFSLEFNPEDVVAAPSVTFRPPPPPSSITKLEFGNISKKKELSEIPTSEIKLDELESLESDDDAASNDPPLQATQMFGNGFDEIQLPESDLDSPFLDDDLSLELEDSSVKRTPEILPPQEKSKPKLVPKHVIEKPDPSHKQISQAWPEVPKQLLSTKRNIPDKAENIQSLSQAEIEQSKPVQNKTETKKESFIELDPSLSLEEEAQRLNTLHGNPEIPFSQTGEDNFSEPLEPQEEIERENKKEDEIKVSKIEPLVKSPALSAVRDLKAESKIKTAEKAERPLAKTEDVRPPTKVTDFDAELDFSMDLEVTSRIPTLAEKPAETNLMKEAEVKKPSFTPISKPIISLVSPQKPKEPRVSALPPKVEIEDSDNEVLPASSLDRDKEKTDVSQILNNSGFDRNFLLQEIKKTIEKVVYELVPEIAEPIIRKEIQRLLEEESE